MAGPDQGWEERQQYGYVNGAAGAVSDLANRVNRLEAVVEQMGPPFAEGDKMEGQTNKWRWECEECCIEYLVEDCCFCSRCGNSRPPWIGTGKTYKEWLGRACCEKRADAIFERMRPPFEWVEPAEQIENLELVDIRHWGVWHPERGWWWVGTGLFMTTNIAIAQAQHDIVMHQLKGFGDIDQYRVRCIEEWADN